jgi:hypothetical protein
MLLCTSIEITHHLKTKSKIYCIYVSSSYRAVNTKQLRPIEK